MVSVLVGFGLGREREKKSLKVATPSISKSSTRNVLDTRNLLVARNVTPRSKSVLGRLVLLGMLYWARLVMFGMAAGGVGGNPVTLGLKFAPEAFSRKVEFD